MHGCIIAWMIRASSVKYRAKGNEYITNGQVSSIYSSAHLPVCFFKNSVLGFSRSAVCGPLSREATLRLNDPLKHDIHTDVNGNQVRKRILGVIMDLVILIDFNSALF